MWGGIYTEASYQLNFNTAFSTTRSDVLVHLSQWQYWWWFWFSFIWTFYYLVITKVVRHRSLKMRPRISTSFRPHGKWGDFIAAIIPTIWCINIICNSNFILRLIEWQTESSLLTIRVRARQWYWVYKFDSKALIDIFAAPKNIGRNKWLFSTLSDVKITESYMDLLELRSQNEWLKDYWNDYLVTEDNDKRELVELPIDSSLSKDVHSKEFYNNLHINSTISYIDDFTITNNFDNYFNNIFSFSNMWDLDDASNYFLLNNTTKSPLNILYTTLLPKFKILNSEEQLIEDNIPSELMLNVNENFSSLILENGQFFDNQLLLNTNNSIFSFNLPLSSIKTIDFIGDSRFIKRTQGLYLPLRIVKNLFTHSDVNELFSLQWGEGTSTIKHKIKPYTTYLTFKQKRYKRKKMINFNTKSVNLDDKIVNVKWKPMLINNRLFVDSEFDPTLGYKMIKKLKKRDDNLPLVLAKRLLRVKRTLIVPAHINLTVITSSYDIIHSWFIPGLGLKLDCVPGRSTHHTFYIDNVGFYVGQCAEICGRYHHHMPIRVCALPFDHFLTWWYHFGAPKLVFTSNNMSYGFRKYVW